MRLVGAAGVAAVLVAVAITGWARSAGRQADVPVTPRPTQTAAGRIPQPDLSGPGGLNVRYLDPNGEVKHLDVKDFPR